jgi:hypothetical protein
MHSFFSCCGNVYQQFAVQQHRLPCCHGNMLSEALASRWADCSFQASCHNIQFMSKICVGYKFLIMSGISFSLIIHRWHNRYSKWLWAGCPRGWSSSSCRGKNCLFSISSRLVLGHTHPPIQWVPWAPGVKQPGRKADHLPPTSAEVKKTWIYTSNPPYALMALCLIS